MPTSALHQATIDIVSDSSQKEATSQRLAAQPKALLLSTSQNTNTAKEINSTTKEIKNRNTITVANQQSNNNNNNNNNNSMALSKRWRHRFNETLCVFLYFRHLRKAAGTTVHTYLNKVAVYHETLRRQRHGIPQQKSAGGIVPRSNPNKGMVVYATLEFNSMDGQCPFVDTKWKDTLSVISLRHPVERTISEFFYSGVLREKELMELYRLRNYGNPKFAELLRFHFPNWIEQGLMATHRGRHRGSLGYHFSDEYQTRSLTAVTESVPNSNSYRVGNGPKYTPCNYYDYYTDKDDNNTTTPQVNSNCVDGPCRYGKSYYKSF
jgi:hypothetical protein